MDLKIIDKDFSICKLRDMSGIDLGGEFCFIGKTDEELSLVCETSSVPPGCIECDGGWKAFRIQGVLDFSLVGILSRISAVLAENSIGIFAVSTYNTDYILVRKKDLPSSVRALENSGYTFVE